MNGERPLLLMALFACALAFAGTSHLLVKLGERRAAAAARAEARRPAELFESCQAAVGVRSRSAALARNLRCQEVVRRQYR